MTEGELPRHPDSLNGPLRRESALAKLGPLTTAQLKNPYRRAFVVNGTKAFDCSGAVVLRASIDVHLAAHEQNRAEIWEPKDPVVWSRVHGLLSSLPDRCVFVEDQKPSERNREIIVPAMRVEPLDIATLLAHTISVSAVHLGIDASPARAVMQALVTLADNARHHAAESPVGVLVACALESDTNELNLVALDLGTGVAGADDPSDALRDAIASSRASLGGLWSLMGLAHRRGLEATLRLASGTARVRWRAGSSARYDIGAPVPGFVASFSVRLS